MVYLLYFLIGLAVVLFFAVIVSISFVFVILTGAPYVATDKKKISTIIKFSKLQPNGRALDLGSGDGRLVIALARQGIETHGYEINPFLVWWSRQRIKRAGLADKAFIHNKNFWKQDISKYNIIVLFGVGTIMKKLQTKLDQELNDSYIVVSNGFPFPSWQYVDKENQIYFYRR